MNSIILRERRAPIANRMRQMREKMTAEGYVSNAEDRQNWQNLNRDYNSLSEQIGIVERQEQVEAEQVAPINRGPIPGRDDMDSRNDPGGDTPQGNRLTARAIQAWCRSQMHMNVRQGDRQAADECQLDLRSPHLDLNISGTNEFRAMQRAARAGRLEERALSVVTGSAGAYTIDSGFVPTLEAAMLAYGGVRPVASVIRTASGNDLTWPTSNDTSTTGELIAQNTEVAAADPTFGATVFRAYKYSSKLILVPVELLEDSAVNLVQELGRMMGERIGRITNTHFTTGNAASKPNGIVTASTLGVTAATGANITPDEVLDLVHSVDPQYRNSPGAGFMFHDAILLHLRKKKDGQGQYIWTGGSVQSGEPDRLLGFPYQINQDMQSSVATGTKTMLFGDLSKYKVRDVASVRVRRLVERYAEKDQEGFVAFFRTDGNLLDAGTHPVKHLLQA